jgi:hypothetical protein
VLGAGRIDVDQRPQTHEQMRLTAFLCSAALLAPQGLSCQATPAGTDDRLYEDAATRAWSWLERNSLPGTGLVRATDHYDHVTTWDIGSALLGLHAAHGLGLLDDAGFEARAGRMLETLAALPLYDGAAFNRLYSARTGEMIGRGDVPTSTGYGWSATDLGRLLTALKVVATRHPALEGRADRVVRRLDVTRILRDGYLWGEDVQGRRTVRYQEGRIGYEQYAAQGFALWGFRAERALDVETNARPFRVEGVEIVADRRGNDRLTGEPFFLAAIEMDLWGEPLNRLAAGVLAAQEARWLRTGQLTMVSEDAVPVPPHHFYYYNVLHDGRAFAIDAQGSMRGVVVRPWLSTKAAFAWHATAPSEYTRAVLHAVVAGQQRERDWGAGILEGNGAPTGGANVNTAAIILEAALHRRIGGRLLAEPASD